MTELESLLILNGISGLGSIRTRRLLERFASAKKVLSLSINELTLDGLIPPRVAENIVRFAKDDFLRNELSLIKKADAKLISYSDIDYPENLSHIPDSPVILYVKGNISKENNLAIAVVGSRRASFYGLSTAEKLSMGLSELGITIVSGMARGIDASAHRGALKAKGPTIAVLGNGLSRIYPPENKKLFEEIARNGAILSEFPMTTPPSAYNFPRRNRIISGLSLGVVVVEASNKSGALITSRFALEQGREVFAVPGKVDSVNSQGVNNLIKQGAKLISNVEDILEEIAPQLKHHMRSNEKQPPRELSHEGIKPGHLMEDELNIYEHIRGRAVHIDEIADRSGCSASQAMSILLKLELKHLIKQLPGKHFIRESGSAPHAFSKQERDKEHV